MTDIGFGWRCASYEGEEAQALLAAFAEASQVTTWDDGGTEYSIKVRPLFPGEEPCARWSRRAEPGRDCGPESGAAASDRRCRDRKLDQSGLPHLAIDEERHDRPDDRPDEPGG